MLPISQGKEKLPFLSSTREDALVNDSAWLSNAAQDCPFFTIPTFNLQKLLQTMGISHCQMFNRFYFDQLPSTHELIYSQSAVQTPWSITHSSLQRCKLAERSIGNSDKLIESVMLELRSLESNSDMGLTTGLATFSELLTPLLTGRPSSDTEQKPDDILLLFGSPPSAFQLLLCVSQLRALILQLTLNLVSECSPYSLDLLLQFRQPVGLNIMCYETETAAHLLEVFQSISDNKIKTGILMILPDLAISTYSSTNMLDKSDRPSPVHQLIDSLSKISIPVAGDPYVIHQDPVAGLIQCISSFAIEGELVEKLQEACFQFLHRCTSPTDYFHYLPMVVRGLIFDGTGAATNSADLTSLITGLRRYLIFPKTEDISVNKNIFSELLDLIRLIVQFNRKLMNEWINLIPITSIHKCALTNEELLSVHGQAVQDLILLTVVYSAANVHTCHGPIPRLQQQASHGIQLSLLDESNQDKRFQRKTLSILRALVTSGRLFPGRLLDQTTDQFFADYGQLVLFPTHGLFTGFLHFINHLISVAKWPGQTDNSVSPELICRPVGLALYVKAFCCAHYQQNDDMFTVQQQEIVHHLVRLALSSLQQSSRVQGLATKTKGMTRSGLSALLRLAQLRPSALANFETMLYGLLDRIIHHLSMYDNGQSWNLRACDTSLIGADLSIIDLIRRAFIIIAVIAFSPKHKRMQEKLLSWLRQHLNPPTASAPTMGISKAVGVIGSVIVLEAICRRTSGSHSDMRRQHLPLQDVNQQNSAVVEVGQPSRIDFENEEESIILSSQLTFHTADLPSSATSVTTTSNNTSRTSSNTSCLSLRGPGAGIADNPLEVNLMDDDEDDDDDYEGRREESEEGEKDLFNENLKGSSDSVLLAAPETPDRRRRSCLIQPPSRLIVQLVGLTEQAVASCSQLTVLWLDELTCMFKRLAQLFWVVGSEKWLATPQPRRRGGSAAGNDRCWSGAERKSVFSVPPDVQASRLLDWMSVRAVRTFQNDFVLDNKSTNDYVLQLGLNNTPRCEVAIALGPVWHQFKQTSPEATAAGWKADRRQVTPSLLPGQLRFLAVTESVRHGGNLDSIDALLGCPLLMPLATSRLDSQPLVSPATKATSCPADVAVAALSSDEPQLLVFTINWCLEAVNAFAPKLISYATRGDTPPPGAPVSSGRDSTSSSVYRRLYRRTALIRLHQVAHLRDRLCAHLATSLLQEAGPCLGPGAPPVPDSHTDRTQAGDLCLPTATYEPGAAFTGHLADLADDRKCSCLFTTGVHPLGGCRLYQSARQSTAKKREKRTTKGGGKAAKRSRQKGPVSQAGVDEGTESARSPSPEKEGDGPRDSETSPEEEEEEEEDQEEGCSSKPVGVSRLTATAKPEGAVRKGSQKSPVTPCLDKLVACFRELELPSLLLGLSSWPWRTDPPRFPPDANWTSSRPIQGRDDEFVDTEDIFGDDGQELVAFHDWSTLLWLLTDLDDKLQHLFNTSRSTQQSWYAFQRLNGLRSDVRSSLLLQAIPHLQRVMQLSIDTFTKANEVDNPDCSLSSLSSSSDNAETGEAGGGEKTGPSSQNQARQRPIRGAASRQQALVPDVVCLALNSLSLLCCWGRQHPSQSAPPWPPSALTLACLKQLAGACGQAGGGTPPTEILVDAGLYSWTVDCWEQAEGVDPGDGEVTVAQYHQLQEDLQLILHWLLGLPSASLPHAVTALLHSHLTAQLIELYSSTCLHLSLLPGCGEKTRWIPDMYNYTKDLLNESWDPTIKWRGLSFRDCLQSLLALHLRSRFTMSGIGASIEDVDRLLRDPDLMKVPRTFTKDVFLPAVKGFQEVSNSDAERGSDRGDYQTLNRRTVDFYFRGILDTVLWFAKQLSRAPPQCGAPATSSLSSSAKEPSALVANWNECLVVISLLSDLVHSPGTAGRARRGGGGGKRSVSRRSVGESALRLLQLSLPNLMRSGRLFLQTLLRSAMPLLASMLRTHGVEVATFLRNTQTLTRFLQRVCTHAKAHRDSRLTNQIPATRRCLETFVCRVKTMLSQNQCLEAFWLGTLKNRDLHGVELGDSSEDDDCASMATTSSGGDAAKGRRCRMKSRSRDQRPEDESESLTDEGAAEGDEDGSDCQSTTRWRRLGTIVGEADASDNAEGLDSEEEEGLVEASDAEEANEQSSYY